MRKTDYIKIIAAWLIPLIVVLVAALSLYGIFTSNNYLASWGGVTVVTMKLKTALMFIIVAIGMVSRPPLSEVMAILIMVLVFTVFLEYIQAISFNINGVLEDGAKSFRPGLPSIGTLFAFVACQLEMAGVKRKYAAISLLMISTASTVGYLFDIPELYYYIDTASTAMAKNTTFLFFIIGLFSFFNLSKHVWRLKDTE